MVRCIDVAHIDMLWSVSLRSREDIFGKAYLFNHLVRLTEVGMKWLTLEWQQNEDMILRLELQVPSPLIIQGLRYGQRLLQVVNDRFPTSEQPLPNVIS